MFAKSQKRASALFAAALVAVTMSFAVTPAEAGSKQAPKTGGPTITNTELGSGR